jgi:GTP 3',8-cyclase
VKSVEPSLIDSYGRVIRKLRLSVIDKCNFRCNFCMPEEPEWLPNEAVLTPAEIERIVTILSNLGVDRVRITGGEPLVRKDVVELTRSLSKVPKLKRLGMTTNGYYLEEKATALRDAGLYSITVSLHSLKESRFFGVTRRDAFPKVLRGVKSAKDAGFESVKVNTVVIRGYNDDEIINFAEAARRDGLVVRFIEYMPFDGRRMWEESKVVTGQEILSKISSRFDVVPLEREPGSTSMNYRFADGDGEFGIITSISKPFCSDCDRIRMTADGKFVPCLFSTQQFDVAPLLRGNESDEVITEFFQSRLKLKSPGVEEMIKQNQRLHHVRPMYITGG